MAEHVTLFEMGPRDGLQNESVQIPTAQKIALVDGLSDCGLQKIEVSSFVSPKWVPQMADAADVFAGITRRDGVSYAALTPNMRGYDGAIAANADEIAIFASASEGFSQKNINCSIDESFDRFAPIITAAKSAGIPVRGYVSCVIKCPYDGDVAPSAVADVAARLFAVGCYEISLGDTIGAGTPDRIDAMLSPVLAGVPADKLAGHYHDTNGRALDNISTSLDRGLRTFDAAVGGLGGCPYAPGAAGNVASESVVQLLHDRGFETGIDLEKLRAMGAFAKSLRTA
ncbi:hydroxymethylglutaryl-CoA lyase [Amylibacter kogurei]|uniref:Hydroxymethylglutaryl-CoA lyase n=1 Tax=Paramylibacter kogurei TaxID=1889778 RepID=A0A2G5K3V3_9RHOB|nr:hydroxymethylglutaryl-CoA lyase [Amylibacter kogurei]PIB24095.1 hydroxymethylglutaryl-CoA lyase [Amylibacter kogurei]